MSDEYELTPEDEARIARLHWPPKQLAPGIAIRRKPTPHNSYAAKVLHRESELVPVIIDERAFYRNCTGSRMSPKVGEDDECPACRGSGFMTTQYRTKDGRLMPTGEVRACPRDCRQSRHERLGTDCGRRPCACTAEESNW